MPPHNDVILCTTNFICNSCNKIFNTNSHLNQHKHKKKPCFPTNFSEPKIDDNSFALKDDKPFNDFMVKYQSLLKQNSSINNIIFKYQAKNKELSAENLKYKLMIKSILQAIYSKKELEGVEDVDELIYLPLKDTTLYTSAPPSNEHNAISVEENVFVKWEQNNTEIIHFNNDNYIMATPPGNENNILSITADVKMIENNVVLQTPLKNKNKHNKHKQLKMDKYSPDSITYISSNPNSGL
jgi:hypothetical protein